jgi:uncharacterized protein (TIGR02265 family)
MGLSTRIRSLVEHCDLEQRLPLVPASAKLRGLYFKNTVAVVREADRLEHFLEIYPESYSAVRWYPVSEFLERLAVAGALLKGPENVHLGMRAIGRHNARAFADSLLGKALIRLLDRDPVRLLKQASSGRRQSCKYGRWELTFDRPGRAVMQMHEEYLWIESYVLGAAEGTMEATGRDVTVSYELDSQFSGRHLLEWQADD